MSKLTRHNVVAHTGPPERHRTCSIYTELQPGNYSVLLGTYMPGMEGPFTLEVITNQSIGEIEQIVPPAYETRAPTAFDKLMDKETIDQSQFMALVAEYGDKEAAVAVAR